LAKIFGPAPGDADSKGRVIPDQPVKAKGEIDGLIACDEVNRTASASEENLPVSGPRTLTENPGEGEVVFPAEETLVKTDPQDTSAFSRQPDSIAVSPSKEKFENNASHPERVQSVVVNPGADGTTAVGRAPGKGS